MTTKYFKLDDITVTVYVRKEASQERVQMFADLYTSKVAHTIPLIVVTQDGVLIDGRHRLMALRYLGEPGYDCEVRQCYDNFDLTMEALKANMGGSKEVTMAEIRKNIIDLLQQKYSRKKIIAGLPFPKEMSTQLYHDAESNWIVARTRFACYLVRDKNYTVEEAAAHYSVTALSVKRELNRMKKREADQESVSDMGTIKQIITNRYYGLTKKQGNYFKKLIDKYENGDLTDVMLTEAMAHVDHQVRIHQSAMNDWKERVKVQIQTRRPLPEMSPKKLVNA
jgi:hypothetical protein